MSVNYYDSNGQKIDKPLATTLEGVPVSFIDVTVTITNTGTKALVCSPSYSYPNALASAMPTAEKILSNTGSKKVAWTSQLINVSQLTEKPARFAVNISCYYVSGSERVYLPPQQGETTILLYDRVIFRTNVEQEQFKNNYDYSFLSFSTSDKKTPWIAYDLNNDTRLEVYVPSNSRSGMNRWCLDTPYSVLLYLPVPFGQDCCSSRTSGGAGTNKWLVYDSSESKLGVCYNSAMDSSQTDWYKLDFSADAETSIKFTEPYYSRNCNGTIPCQERYI
jgi:hypothetical protein